MLKHWYCTRHKVNKKQFSVITFFCNSSQFPDFWLVPWRSLDSCQMSRQIRSRFHVFQNCSAYIIILVLVCCWRQKYGIYVGDVNRSEECLSVREAMDLYTVGGAYSAMQEHRLGRLLPGYQADFVLLDSDICSSPTDLLSAKVLQVWVAGIQKFWRQNASTPAWDSTQ